MLELVSKLQENDFTIYIVTATERNIVREIIKGTLNIPACNVIGTEYGYIATGQGVCRSRTGMTDNTGRTGPRAPAAV